MYKVFIFLVFSLAGCASTQTSRLKEQRSREASESETAEVMIRMGSAEKRFRESQRQELVAFMSLETMFPDTQVRALAKAASKGDTRRIQELVKEGVSANARGTRGATPLFWAQRDYMGFKKLLECGADPNVVYEDGNSVMHSAVNLKDRRILAAALEHGGNPNLPTGDSSGDTPLYKVLGSDMETVDLLLKHGADIDARNKLGSTPVLTAASIFRFETVYGLLERGANYTLRDRHGDDLPIIVARSIGRISPGTHWASWQQRVFEWLEAKGVKVPRNTRPSSRTKSE